VAGTKVNGYQLLTKNRSKCDFLAATGPFFA